LESDNAVSLGDYVAAVKRRRLLALAIALPLIVLGAVLALALPDVYRSTATFRIVTDRIAETTADQANTPISTCLGSPTRFSPAV
jgi:uncharacterized protein involved in exopolysaccharide biosynthesis